MLENLLIIYHIILSVSFLCSSTVYFRKTEFKYLRLFAPFLLLTLIIEIGASIVNNIAYNKVYNIFIIIEFNFYYVIQIQMIKSIFFKKALKILIPVYTIFAIINIIFIQGFDYTTTYSHNLGSLFLVLFCIICFNEMFKSKTLIIKKPAFWICSGLIFYYACTLPLMASTHIFIDVSPEEYKVLSIIQVVSNYFLYPSFAMAILSERIFNKLRYESEDEILNRKM